MDWLLELIQKLVLTVFSLFQVVIKLSKILQMYNELLIVCSSNVKN